MNAIPFAACCGLIGSGVMFATLNAEPRYTVTDGDSLKSVMGDRIRLVGFDAPETYQARCAEELKLGNRATERMRELLATRKVTMDWLPYRDKYGRLLATLYLDGVNAADIMVGEGLAVYYSGHVRRIDWCARLQGRLP